MNDLGINITEVLQWFTHELNSPYVLIQVSNQDVAAWPDILSSSVRRCYVADDELEFQCNRTGRSASELLAARLPDRGSTMAGDFGEILVYIYHATQEVPNEVIGPKKWRMKQDRTKPAPFSDVVQFVLPQWPNVSEQDQVLCSEVKLKSTSSNRSPIMEAISGCENDRTGRLVKTLAWLKERALHEDLGTTTVEHIERFIHATDHPPAKKHFRAIAVVCASLVDDELSYAPDEKPAEYTVVVIAVPGLKQLYEQVFDAALATVANGEVAT